MRWLSKKGRQPAAGGAFCCYKWKERHLQGSIELASCSRQRNMEWKKEEQREGKQVNRNRRSWQQDGKNTNHFKLLMLLLRLWRWWKARAAFRTHTHTYTYTDKAKNNSNNNNTNKTNTRRETAARRMGMPRGVRTGLQSEKLWRLRRWWVLFGGCSGGSTLRSLSLYAYN